MQNWLGPTIAPRKRAMNDPSNLCLSCGICCNGTALGFVLLEQQDLTAMRELMDIDEGSKTGVFFQPCPKLDGNCCTIYEKRPTACRRFECGLLKSLDKGELNIDSAQDVIKLVKQLRESITQQLAKVPVELKSDAFYLKLIELKKWIFLNPLKSSFERENGQLMDDLNQFENLLSKHFGLDIEFSH